jgi:hypothetical protein
VTLGDLGSPIDLGLFPAALGYDSLDQFRKDFKRHLELELNHPKYRWLQLPERLASVSLTD